MTLESVQCTVAEEVHIDQYAAVYISLLTSIQYRLESVHTDQYTVSEAVYSIYGSYITLYYIIQCPYYIYIYTACAYVLVLLKPNVVSIPLMNP